MYFVFSKEGQQARNSGVRDAIDDLWLCLMLSEILLIDCFEMAGQALGLHRVHNRGTLLDSLWWVSIYKAEVLECLWIRSREFEVCRNVSTQSATKNRKCFIASHLLTWGCLHAHYCPAFLACDEVLLLVSQWNFICKWMLRQRAMNSKGTVGVFHGRHRFYHCPSWGRTHDMSWFAKWA